MVPVSLISCKYNFFTIFHGKKLQMRFSQNHFFHAVLIFCPKLLNRSLRNFIYIFSTRMATVEPRITWKFWFLLLLLTEVTQKNFIFRKKNFDCRHLVIFAWKLIILDRTVATLILNLNFFKFCVSDDSFLRKHPHSSHAFFGGAKKMLRFLI